MQVDDMDTKLRMDIWDAVMKHYIPIDYVELGPNSTTSITNFFRKIQTDFFKEPIHELPDNSFKFQFKLKNAILDYLKWNQVYDLIEFLAFEFKKHDTNQAFMNYCNKILEKHNSVYRFVSGKITRIISEAETREIEKAMNSPIQDINIHFARAWDLISNQTNQDIQKSIKESIKAVEFICQKITNNPVATLGSALEEIAKQRAVRLSVHPWENFIRIRGHSRTFGEISASFSNEKGLNASDARFMLVFCSSLVNYLISKTEHTKIKLI